MTTNTDAATRNLRLDLIRVISCVLIVCMHNTGLTSRNLQVSNVSDIIVLAIRVITRVAVPAFMGLSGYFMFFYKDRPLDYGIKNAPRYIVMLLFWGGFYWVFGFDLPTLRSIETALEVFDRTLWHLWYLKLYVVILLVFPIAQTITKDKKITKIYAVMWFILFSCRFTIGIAKGIFPQIQTILELIQFPFFEYTGYVGGTLGSERPTTYMGAFIVIGAFIYLLEKRMLSDKQKRIVLFAALGGFVTTEAATVGLAVWKSEYMPFFEEPVELHIVLMTMGFILLFYIIPMDRFLQRNSLIINNLANCSLGVYIIHEFIRTLYQKSTLYSSLESVNIILSNLVTCCLNVLICFAVVYLIKKIVPKGVCKYFM